MSGGLGVPGIVWSIIKKKYPEKAAAGEAESTAGLTGTAESAAKAAAGEAESTAGLTGTAESAAEELIKKKKLVKALVAGKGESSGYSVFKETLG